MSCLAISELSESQIDAMSRDLRKRIALFRITSFLDQLPATTPDLHPVNANHGAVVAGASHLEPQL